jgi:hypothetical protein
VIETSRIAKVRSVSASLWIAPCLDSPSPLSGYRKWRGHRQGGAQPSSPLAGFRVPRHSASITPGDCDGVLIPFPFTVPPRASN